jgi:hypothetical protein
VRKQSKAQNSGFGVFFCHYINDKNKKRAHQKTNAGAHSDKLTKTPQAKRVRRKIMQGQHPKEVK